MDRPENLQLVKDEPMTPPHMDTPPQFATPPQYVTPPNLVTPPHLLTPPHLVPTPRLVTTPPHVVPKPEEPVAAPSNIKERLNLHLKRRLKQDPVQQMDCSDSVQQQSLYFEEDGASGVQQPVANEKPPKAKQRRIYQKRSKPQQLMETGDGGAVAAEVSPMAVAIQRKYKRHKMKHTQVGNLTNTLALQGSNNDGMLNEGGASTSAAAGGGGATPMDDECSQDDAAADGEGKAAGGGTGREKEKCPDVLGLVLSVKKRALMRNPDLQAFLQRLMETIKR